MKVVSLKLSPAEAKAETIEAQENEAPRYPWGLTLSLEDEALDKLGLGRLEVGATVAIAGAALVTGYSETETQGNGKRRCLSLQITDLGVDAALGKTLARKMYSDMAE